MFQMGGNFIEYDNHSEIVVVSEKMLKGNVKKRYGGLTKMYGGTIKDMILELEAKNREIEIIRLKYDNELQKALSDSELQKALSDSELQKALSERREFELLLKIKDMELKNLGKTHANRSNKK
jgi:hypothetical protein